MQNYRKYLAESLPHSILWILSLFILSLRVLRSHIYQPSAAAHICTLNLITLSPSLSLSCRVKITNPFNFLVQTTKNGYDLNANSMAIWSIFKAFKTIHIYSYRSRSLSLQPLAGWLTDWLTYTHNTKSDGFRLELWFHIDREIQRRKKNTNLLVFVFFRSLPNTVAVCVCKHAYA